MNGISWPPETLQDQLVALLAEDEEVATVDGFDIAFIGIGRQFNKVFAVYDRAKCINILEGDMSYDEAEEYFQFNVAGAYVGESTPCFLETI